MSIFNEIETCHEFCIILSIMATKPLGSHSVRSYAHCTNFDKINPLAKNMMLCSLCVCVCVCVCVCLFETRDNQLDLVKWCCFLEVYLDSTLSSISGRIKSVEVVDMMFCNIQVLWEFRKEDIFLGRIDFPLYHFNRWYFVYHASNHRIYLTNCF